MEQVKLIFDCNPNCICIKCARNQFQCEHSDCPWCDGDGMPTVTIQTPIMGEVPLICNYFVVMEG